MPRKREEETGEEEISQKRRKYNKSSLDIVEDMETVMDVLTKLLPKDYAINIVIYRIPRELLESAISAEKVSTDSEEFKRHCKARASGISADINSPTAEATGGFLFLFISWVSS
jgi:DNA-directed RNA polymerase subunit L